MNNDTPITFTLSRDKELAFMKVCVSAGVTMGEKLNSLIDDFLCNRVKLTSVATLPNKSFFLARGEFHLLAPRHRRVGAERQGRKEGTMVRQASLAELVECKESTQ